MISKMTKISLLTLVLVGSISLIALPIIANKHKVPKFTTGRHVITCPYCGAEVTCNALPIYPCLWWNNFHCPKCGKVICKMPQGSSVHLIGSYYTFSLGKVEKSKEAKQKYGQGSIFMEKEILGFEDSLIKISFGLSAVRINFSIYNKISNSIKIIWDEAAYIDENNLSHRIIHSGVKYITRDEPQAPSVVVPGKILEDLVYPTDYVYWNSGKYGGWKGKPLLPKDSRAKELWEKEIGVLLPLKIENTVYEYTFVFKLHK